MREIGKWSYTKVIGVLGKKLAINAICAFAGLQAFHDVLVDKPLPWFVTKILGKELRHIFWCLQYITIQNFESQVMIYFRFVSKLLLSHPFLVEITCTDIHNRLSKNILIIAYWNAEDQARTSVFKVLAIYRKSCFCFSDCYWRSLARFKGTYSGGKTIDRETISQYITIVENQWYNSLNKDYW